MKKLVIKGTISEVIKTLMQLRIYYNLGDNNE